MAHLVVMTSMLERLGFATTVIELLHDNKQIDSLSHLCELISPDLGTNLVRDLCHLVGKPGVGVG